MFLKIQTDEGLAGWGEPVVEGRARSVEAAVAEIGESLLGKDPLRINDHWQTLYRGAFYRGGAVFMSAMAGIDPALWDIKGKALGAPVYPLLGGLVRDRMKTYCWVGGDRPAALIAQIRARLERGFDTFKLNACEELGVIDSSRAIDAAVAKVAEIRAAFGNTIDFGLDFHGRLADQTAIPLAAGERMYSRFEFKHVLARGGIAILQPDPSHAGGITKCVRIAAMAEAYATHPTGTTPCGVTVTAVLRSGDVLDSGGCAVTALRRLELQH